jgi:hypothetical protein
VIEATNEVLAIFNKDGSAAPAIGQNTLSLTTLFPGNTGGSIFDPHVVYDPANGGHFLLTAAEHSTSGTDAAYLDIAASTGSSPDAKPSSWHTYRVNVMETVSGTDYWLDFPNLGIDSTAIYVTGNLFSFSNQFYAAKLATFDKAAIENGTYRGPACRA